MNDAMHPNAHFEAIFQTENRKNRNDDNVVRSGPLGSKETIMRDRKQSVTITITITIAMIISKGKEITISRPLGRKEKVMRDCGVHAS